MNKVLISCIIIFFLVVTFSLIGNFFDIDQLYYLPFVLWGVTLCIMNMFLEKKHENVFMKEVL